MKLKMLLTLALVAGLTAMSYAKSHFITPGARASGYGTAFVAIADDLTAIYYNPAGLAYQKDTQVMLSCFYINHPVTASSKYDLGAPYGVPGVLTSDKYSTNAAVPFIAFSTKFFYDTTIAAGVYVLGGGGGKVEGLPAGYKIEGQQSYMVYNISLAKKLSDKFSVGLGFDAIQFQDKLVVNALGVDYNRSAFGFQGNVGLMYKPIKKLSTAFVLRSGAYVDVPNEPYSSNPAFKENVCYPLTWELGFAYDLFDDFTFAASVSQNKTSWTSVRYHDIFQYRVGTEYRATEKLALHLGFFSDPNLIKDQYKDEEYGLTNLDMYNMKYVMLGAEYQFTDALKLGLTLTHSFTNPVTHNGITYKYEVNLGRLDISYKFL